MRIVYDIRFGFFATINDGEISVIFPGSDFLLPKDDGISSRIAPKKHEKSGKISVKKFG
jgi:hypothetical protein